MFIFNFLHAVCAWYARVYTWYAEKLPHAQRACKLPYCNRCAAREGVYNEIYRWILAGYPAHEPSKREREYREAGMRRAQSCVNCAAAIENGDDYSGCWLHGARSHQVPGHDGSSFQVTDAVMANSRPATAEDVRDMMRALHGDDIPF
jgi:hypothetical protein